MTKASLGQGQQLLQLFSSHSREEVQRLIGAGDLLDMLMQVPDPSSVDRTKLAEALGAPVVPWPPYHDIFATPQDILDFFGMANSMFDWGLDNRITTLRDEMPRDFVSTQDHVLAIMPWFEDTTSIATKLWSWVDWTHRLKGEESNKSRQILEFFKLDDTSMYPAGAGAYWVVISIYPNTGVSVEEAVSYKQSSNTKSWFIAGPELLAAAAVHPRWAQLLGTHDVPQVALANLRYIKPAPRNADHVPLLRTSGETGLGISYENVNRSSSRHVAIPTVGHLKDAQL